MTEQRDSRLEELLAIFGRWLHLPDESAVLAVLGAVAANRLDGDPVWLLLVGPPGGGKSETLQALGDLPHVHSAATLTEAALLSGTPKKEHADSAKGGLLRVMGEFGIVVAKDFGSVLSMNRDARAALLAALREVYDGSWTRHVGTDGGRTLSWSGKVGFVGGCTPTIDRHHAVMGAMGERFLLYRLPEVDENVQAGQALAHAGRELVMRRELRSAVLTVLGESQLARQPRARTGDETEQLIALATFVVRARSAVERDGYTREIELVPAAEAPTRLVIVLDRFLAGLDAIGLDRGTAWGVVRKAALDCVPALRLETLRRLHGADELSTTAVADELGYPTGTIRRTLEDLAAHGLANRTARGEGRAADRWAESAWASERLELCVPDLSSNTRSGRVREHSETDISGTQSFASDVSGTQTNGSAPSHASPVPTRSAREVPA